MSLRLRAWGLGGLWLVTTNPQLIQVPPTPDAEYRDERGYTRKLVSPPPYWSDNRLVAEVRFGTPTKPAPRESDLYGTSDIRELDDLSLNHVRLIDAQVVTGRDAARAIAAATGVGIVLDGQHSRSLVAVPNSGATARELMEAIGRLLGGRWFRDEDKWVFARAIDHVALITLDPAERDRRRSATIRNLVLSLQEGQWTRLARAGFLPWEELTREQKILVLDELKLDFHDPDRMRDRAPIEEALFGKGLALRLTGSQGSARFGIACGGADGKPYAPTSPFYNPATRELTWGVLPPR
jgi:hypothetical protein